MNKMTEEQLERKEDQHWDMAGLARQDGDGKDAARHTKKAQEYHAERSKRFNQV